MESVNWWRSGPLAWVEVNRPDKLNSLGTGPLLRLRYHLQDALAAPEIRVVLLTGAGERAFVAGADIAEMHGLDASGVRDLMNLGKDVAALIEYAPKPVLAVVNGYALGGGCELALACDLVLAADTAQFGLPEVDLGILPGWGGTQRLERRVGYGRARDMILTGRRVPADEALTWGLCDRVFPAATLRKDAEELALALAAKDPAPLSAARQALRAAATDPPDQGLALETDLVVGLFERPERLELMGRFVKKR